MNCKAEVYGRFCHVCGQENIEPKETFWGLISHFIYDITHFDGKFFSTVKYLMFRPGYLSLEYMRGRRMSYLHPIRMYVFTSAIFFLFFFSLFDFNDMDVDPSRKALSDSIQLNLEKRKAEALKGARTTEDSMRIIAAIDRVKSTTGQLTSGNRQGPRGIDLLPNLGYKSVEEYDSLQQRLPSEKRDGWFTRTTTRKKISFRDKMRDDPKLFFKQWANQMIHRFPQLLFVSLPFFALILKLLYNRRKNYYYGDHAIFTIHLYIFTFVLLFLLLLLNNLNNATGWGWLGYIQFAMILYMVFYVYKAMRKFYQQGRFKTFIKFSLLGMMSFTLIIFLFLCFVILSIFQL